MSTRLNSSRHGLEAIGNRRRRDDDARIIALSRAQHLPEIALLGFGRHSGGRPGALHVDADQRNFHHGRGAETLGHQRKAAARGRAHGAAAGVSGADRHVDDTDLIFHLAHDDIQLARVPCHPVENSRRRAHRIGAVKPHSRSCAAHRQSLITFEER